MAIILNYNEISVSIPFKVHTRYILYITFYLSGHKARPLEKCGGSGGKLEPRGLVLPLQSIDGVHPAGPKCPWGSSGPKKRKEKKIRKKNRNPKEEHKGQISSSRFMV
jgi:hypothetical protein